MPGLSCDRGAMCGCAAAREKEAHCQPCTTAALKQQRPAATAGLMQEQTAAVVAKSTTRLLQSAWAQGIRHEQRPTKPACRRNVMHVYLGEGDGGRLVLSLQTRLGHCPQSPRTISWKMTLTRTSDQARCLGSASDRAQLDHCRNCCMES